MASPDKLHRPRVISKKDKAFFELVKKFRAATDPTEVRMLGEKLGRAVFGGRPSSA